MAQNAQQIPIETLIGENGEHVIMQFSRPVRVYVLDPAQAANTIKVLQTMLDAVLLKKATKQ